MSSADMVMLGPALKAQLGVRSPEDLIAAGRFADAAAMCADEVASCRKAVEAFESQGRSLSPQTAQAFDARITTALQLMGYAEASTRDFKQALSHTAEALQIARRLANGDSAHIMHLVNGLTAFAIIRLAARTDLTQAGDATAEAIAILYELDGQPPDTYQQKLALVRDVGTEILNVLARPQSTH